MAANWSDLSTELKQNVVGRLDLMSRHSLRSTCRLNRFVVDFTEFFVPRVRVSVKDSEFLIMIHTGIDKFLRIEMRIGSGGKTIIRKLQNSYHAKDAIEKVLPSTPRYHAAQILCGLLSREKTLIGVMEWEFEGGIDVKNQADEQTSIQATIAKIVSLVNFFQKFSGKSQIFRANKLMTSWNLNLDMEACLKQMFVQEDLRKIERVGLMTSTTSLTPAASCDSYVPLSGMGIPCGTNSVLHEYDPMHWNMFMLVSCQTPGFGVLRFAQFNDTAKELWNSVKEPIEKISDKKYRKVCLVGTFNGRILMMHERSPCGYWVYGILEKNQRVFEDYRRLNFNSCGLGWLCKKCTDPFEYNYYQNLGRRVFLEPKWSGIWQSGVNHETKALSDKKNVAWKCYKEDEKMKKDSGENSGEGTMVQKMWGFGNQGVEDISQRMAESVKIN
ncbi:hypothetical protein CRE_15691 [Caenorhabditis remanei]|uniref:F-box domain-containing protein n=1 Tax=Caenorhabditis remanei TaxID=31234 RepID=E3N877_CAERE|nr:hypothetical protein CRE_15691 [Caenorhabditis remanei]